MKRTVSFDLAYGGTLEVDAETDEIAENIVRSMSAKELAAKAVLSGLELVPESVRAEGREDLEDA